MNGHPYITQKKERSGWGKWHTVIIRKCIETGKEIGVIKNWQGPKPKGAIACPHCNKFMDL